MKFIVWVTASIPYEVEAADEHDAITKHQAGESVEDTNKIYLGDIESVEEVKTDAIT